MAELETNPHIEVVLGDEDGVPVVRITGELDLSTAETARVAMAPAVEGAPPCLVLDLSGLGFMDSTGIALMVSLTRLVGRVDLRHPSQSIRRLIEVTGLVDTFRIVE
jgi:anti-sigma B factor antagonist